VTQLNLKKIISQVTWLAAFCSIIAPSVQTLADPMPSPSPFSGGDVFSITNNSEFYDPNANSTCGNSSVLSGTTEVPQNQGVDISNIVSQYNLQSAIIQQVGADIIASYRANKPPNTPASTMKLIIADTALQDGLDLSQTVAIHKDVYYDGRNDLGVDRIKLNDALIKMLSVSSNVAANVLMKALGGVDTFTQKAQSYGYSNTEVKGYYDPSNDGKNSSTINDEVAAMSHLFSTDGSGYTVAKNALKDAAQNDNYYGVDDKANKWAGTSTVAGNVGLFHIGDNDYVIGLYINKPATDPEVKNAIKNASADLASAVSDATNNDSSGASSDGTACCTAGGSTSLTGSDPQEKAWNFFRSQGLDPMHTAAVIGNLMQESHLDAQEIQDGGDTENPAEADPGGWGIAQWTPGSKIINIAKSLGIDGPIYELSTQLQIVWAEMKNTSPAGVNNTLDGLNSQTTLEDAVNYFMVNFEAAGVAGPRVQYAQNALDKYGNSAPSALAPYQNGGCVSTSTSPDCQAAVGVAKILCAAKQYDSVSYSETVAGGHQGGAAWHRACPVVGPSCILDCSGLVNIAVYDVTGTDLRENTFSEVTDIKYWEHISFNQIQPGDLIQPASRGGGHVEIIDHVQGDTMHTFGAHSSTYPQPDQVGPSSFTRSSGDVYLHYKGPGL
jgi:hypothetical protein